MILIVNLRLPSSLNCCKSTVEDRALSSEKAQCSVCGKCWSSITCVRNFSDCWITGMDSLCTIKAIRPVRSIAKSITTQ